MLRLSWMVLAAAAIYGQSFDPAIFKSPPAAYRGHAMWDFNLNTLDEKYVVSGIDEMARLNYGGFFIEAAGQPQYGRGVEFLSDEYFRHYRLAMEEARKRGLEVILYDDYRFPTGTVGGQLRAQHPEAMAKTLNMVEKDATGEARVELAIPEGIYAGAAIMNRDTFELRDVSDRRAQSRLVVEVPKGSWKVMAFYLAEGKSRVVDYLDQKAMSTFIAMTYEKYQQRLGDYFGNLITQTFYDEPSMHHTDRMWTPRFNELFQQRYGYSPAKYYPALWYDIGPQTAAARNALFGFRAQLFAENFIQRLDDWCREHKLAFGGHLDQEEPLNPTPLAGDLLKVFQHQSLPTVDDIWWYGRSNPSYKIVTSAAFIYDHPIARAETYAAYRILDEKIAYQVAMDQYAMGINYQIPARTVQPRRPELNTYVGRLSYLLQHGRHVADVAVLYPIASLYAQYRNLGGVEFARAQGEAAPQIREEVYAREGGFAFGMDYQNVGEALFRALRVDYTYLHPEVLVERCSVQGNKLVLNNRENREEYSVVILPAGGVLHAAAAAKLKSFYDAGGTVIATGKLPEQSAEFGKNGEVRQAIYDVFGVSPSEPLRADVRRAQDRQNFYVFWYSIRKNAAGGQGIFLPSDDPWLLDYALKAVLPRRDVTFDEPMGVLRRGAEYDGALTYIHKIKEGRDIYFFANSSPKAIDAKVMLRGRHALRIWNPHTGEQEAAEVTPGDDATTIRLVLPPVRSVFYVSE